MADMIAPTGQAPTMAPHDTIQYDKTAGYFRCQLDEQWFVLTKDTLRKALQITPVNINQAFISPPTAEVLINFVNELGYPNAKGTKREVFGMPISGSLITAEIREASYYQKYLAKVALHRRYLAGETGGVQDPPAPKPTQPVRKPNSKTTKAPPRPAVTSTQLAPTLTPAEPQSKKRKQATETSDKPPKAKKKYKYGWVSKKCSLKHVATSEAEDVLLMEPQITAEDAELQKVLEESMKTAYAAAPRGPLPSVVIREPESGKYQPLLEVPGKGKAKVSEEQVAHDLLSLQKPKKKSPADQYILQRRISEPVGSSLYDDSPYAVLGQSDSEEESEKFVLGATEGGNDEDQAGPDPDEGFTATFYLKVQESLKLAVEEQVLLEEPASSSGTLFSLQHLSKDISFGDLFFSDKPSNADKNAETDVESMSDHGSLTFQVLQTAACGLHEFCRIQFPTCAVKDLFHVSLRLAMMCSSSPIRCIIMASVLLCCGACGGVEAAVFEGLGAAEPLDGLS
nr:hypothetical protein [Tanacetum cinerariifolium]